MTQARSSMTQPASTWDSGGIRPWRSESGTLDRLHSPILRRDLTINGAQACATSNCHGGPRPGVSQPSARRGMEYQLWVENDPHAQSWRTMCSDESIAIMQRLKIMDGNDIIDPVGFDNCLACHNSTKRYDEPRQTPTEHFASHRTFNPVSIHTGGTSSSQGNEGDVDAFRREGVGCAGCHGPSEQWIYTHFQYNWSPRGATAQGFVEAGDLYVRARMCASCHVGDKDRDMNHDIIAAGHPALRYELATFHAWQPKHWRDAEANDKTYYEAQLWLAGQIAATDASLALLQARAAEAHTVSQWPELAAYDCASCHHNLGLDNDRRPFADNRNATAIYSQWNDVGLRWLVNHRVERGEATQVDFELLAALDSVKASMESRPQPNRDAVVEAAGHARRVLAGWFDGAPGVRERNGFRSGRLGEVVASAAGRRATFGTWESAAQFYLAAVAARESWPGGWHGPLQILSDRMRLGLRYPNMIDVSRYAKRDGSGPTLNRSQARALGVELAGWLGPVAADMRWEAEDESPQDARRLQELMDQINARWEQRQREREATEAEANETKPGMMDAPPRRQPKTAQELLEERERARDNTTESGNTTESDNTTESNDSP